ncbi:MAG: DUF58 domain-containing protein [Verrucomicrobiota bacterium]
MTDSVTGAYHSSFKGRGMDFEEVREYALGDEVRTIDWNVSAKMDRPFVKVFREERELTLMLLVDLSASGVFGSVSESKRERAAEIASVLAFSASLNNDKVGLLLYTDQVEHFIPAKKGRRHILRVIRDILCYEPKGRQTNHREALDYLNRIQRRKAVVFLISDFLENQGTGLSEESDLFKALSLTNQRHDLVSIALNDPRESELPNVGLITLEDAETGETIEVDTGSATVRERYAKEAQHRRQTFTQIMRRRGLDWIETDTALPYMPALRQLFARRASRH